MTQNHCKRSPDNAYGRRDFLRRSAIAGAGLGSLGLTGRANATVRSRAERRSVVVLGSGFGGAVTALRLVQAGVHVTLIERGQRWASGNPGVFPTILRPDRRVSWLSHENSMSPYAGLVGPWPLLPLPKYTGLVERIKGSGISIVCGSAYGGGSLTYQGMSVQPRADIWDRVMPKELDYEEFDARWFPLAGAGLGIEVMPDDVQRSAPYAGGREWSRIVRAAGYPDPVRVPLTVDWNVVRDEIAGRRPRVLSSSDVAYGANSPGKRTLDQTYLAQAEATGRLEVLTLHDCEGLERDEAGRWRLRLRRINTGGTLLERVTLTTDALFLCAGSGNTTKLLVEAKARSTVPDLPADVGHWWSNNGDLVTIFILPKPLGEDRKDGGPAYLASKDWDNPAGPITLKYAPFLLPSGITGMGVPAIHLPAGFGSFKYSSSDDRAKLVFPPGTRNAEITEARRRVARIGRQAGAIVKLDQTASDPTTWHPLGGAVIGKVTDAYGRVLGQNGLYISDGALIPGSTACTNPSYTIAALAERNIDAILRSDLGVVFNAKA